MEAELFLDGLGGKSHLPTNVALSRRHATVDESQLDAISLVQRESVFVGCREIVTPTASAPKLLHRRLDFNRHAPSLVVLALSAFHTTVRGAIDCTALQGSITRPQCVARPSDDAAVGPQHLPVDPRPVGAGQEADSPREPAGRAHAFERRETAA